ncbi:fimbrial protein SefA [Salmonella enterica]|nr:fimbrial protein SefA [Salmonella enterica]EHJ0757506.1 fimbrial protein SefA [Salmonella enterica]
MRKLSVIALALAVSGAAHAGLVGNKFTVSAPITVSANNNTTVTWAPAGNITVSGFAVGHTLGTLNISATGSHDSIRISGEDVAVRSGVVNIPFKNEQGEPGFRGRFYIEANAIDVIDSGIDGQPGWRIDSTDESFSLPVRSLDPVASLNPGTYTATFYVQQWKN